MDAIAYIKIGLGIANALIYAYAIHLYLQPQTAPPPYACPLCGTHTDALCVGLHMPRWVEATPALTSPPVAPPAAARQTVAQSPSVLIRNARTLF